MTPREFTVMWISVLGFTGAVVGWALLMSEVVFPHQAALAVICGVAPFVVILMFVSWWVLRDG